MNAPILDVATIAAAVGYLATQTIDLVKPWLEKRLGPEAKEPALRLLTLVITALWAVAGGFAAEHFGLLGPDGMWLVVTATFPAVGGWFQVESRRKLAKQKVGQNG